MMARYLKGKRVAFAKQGELGTYKIGGSYADYVITEDSTCLPLPDDCSFDQGASWYVNPLTAVCMVDRVKELQS